MYAIFTGYGIAFHGLYRSLPAAQRLVSKLKAEGYCEPTAITITNGEFTEEQFLALDWGQRASYWAVVNCIEHNYFGRRKYDHRH